MITSNEPVRLFELSIEPLSGQAGGSTERLNMANRRMFSKEITNSSEFQMMSPSAQALYLHIGMNSDDDGFCEVFTIVRMTESKPDDLRALHERGFVYLIDSKVGIVKDWHTNNDIRSDRYTRSKHLDNPQYADVYMAIMEDKIQHLSRYKNTTPTLGLGITSGITSGMTQDRIGKDRIEAVADAPATYEVSEEEPEYKKPKKETYPNARKVFKWFPDREPSWGINSTELKCGSLLFDRGEDKVKKAIAYCVNHMDEEGFPIPRLSPYLLETNWPRISAYGKR